MDIVSILQEGLSRSGLSPAEASRLAVGNEYYLYGVLKKKQKPSIENIEKLCAVLGLECYIGPPRGVAARATLPDRVRRSLGLPLSSTEDQAVQEIRKMQARNQAYTEFTASIAKLDTDARGAVLEALQALAKAVQ